MRILGIESSAKAASCALVCDGALEAVSFQNVGLTHSQTLMPMIEAMMKNTGIPLDSVEVIAASHGPGSFTGVRIGVATALGIAAGSGKPVVGVSTLAAMAEQVSHTGCVVVCAMDARRNEVYAAAFDGAERLCDDCAVPAAEFAVRAAVMAKERGKPIICIGDGAELCYDLLAQGVDTCYNCPQESCAVRLAPPHLLRQSAVGVAMLAWRVLSNGGELPPLRPVYLRQSQAERERAAKQQK